MQRDEKRKRNNGRAFASILILACSSCLFQEDSEKCRRIEFNKRHVNHRQRGTNKKGFLTKKSKLMPKVKTNE